MIDLHEARLAAEDLADGCLKRFVRARPESWLREGHLEAKKCWLFLKAKDIDFLPQSKSWSDIAFVISKKGKQISIADHYEDMDRLKEYIEKMSAYLEERGE